MNIFYQRVTRRDGWPAPSSPAKRGFSRAQRLLVY
jgi:hypothetical protein